MFSETEEKVLKLLGSKKLSIAKLTEEFFKGQKKPINPNAVVSSAINRINKKADFHNLEWFISGKGLGRSGRTVWKMKRGME